MEAGAGTPPRGVLLGSFVVMLVAVLLRGAALTNAFWLDEIWSWNFAQQLKSWTDVFTIHHDNNHPLNTLFLYWMGDQDGWVPYRILAWASGILTVGLLMRLEWRSRPWQALMLGLLSGCSLLLVTYSTEARGYAPAGLFAVLAFLLQPTARDPGRLRMPVRGLAMAVVQALGLLSHFSFVFVTLSLVGYSGMKALRSREDRLEPLQLHLLPLLTLATLYLGLVRGQTLGGGPELGVLDVVSSTAALLLGVPDTSPLKWVALGFLVLLQLGGLQVLRREGRDDWLFFALVCFCVPALVLVIARPELLYPRYFFVCLPFALYLLSVALYALIEAGGVQAGIGFVALVLVIAGNARALKDFYQDGRGHYLEAMRYMVEKTPNKLLVIASDHDFRSQAIIRYYAQFLPSDRQIYYVEGKQFAELGSQWYLIHSQDAHPQVPQEFQDPRGARYVLEQVYPYSSLSGWHWFLYHNVSEQE